MAIIEGLVLALAPLRFDELLVRLREMDPKLRQNLGYLSVVAGGILIWISKYVTS